MLELPDIQFIDVDSNQIISDIMTRYEFISGRTLQRSDPVYLFLLALGYEKVHLMQQFELGLRGNLLAYAEDDALDHIGTLRDTKRFDESPSYTTLRFTLSTVRPGATLIPEGTRATADNIVYFATTENAEIPAGQLSVDVEAKSSTIGEVSNNIEVGSINNRVDLIPFVEFVTNITVTQGGRARESNESYRERIYEAPAAFSVAGPEDAYIYLAKSANASIADVSASSPTPGTVEIRPILANGEIPSQTILDQVIDAVSPKDKRPLADNVVVLAPTPVTYNLSLTYYIDKANQGRALEIQSAVNQAIFDWQLWQRIKMGRDINPSELTKRIVQAGAKRVVILSPSHTVLTPAQLGVIGTQTIIYGGLEDE